MPVPEVTLTCTEAGSVAEPVGAGMFGEAAISPVSHTRDLVILSLARSDACAYGSIAGNRGIEISNIPAGENNEVQSTCHHITYFGSRFSNSTGSAIHHST